MRCATAGPPGTLMKGGDKFQNTQINHARHHDTGLCIAINQRLVFGLKSFTINPSDGYTGTTL